MQQKMAAQTIDRLNDELQKNTAWALETNRKLEEQLATLAATVKLLDQAEALRYRAHRMGATSQRRSRGTESTHGTSARIALDQARQDRWTGA